MKKFSIPVKAILTTGVYSGFSLIEMIIRGEPLRYTTMPYDVVVGNSLYSSDSRLASVSPPAMSTNTGREAFKITFADPERSFAPLCDEMANSRISIRAGLFNTLGASIIDSSGRTVGPNQPLLDIRDTLLIYKGFIDVVGYTMSEEAGFLLNLECASPMAKLDASNSFYTTPTSLRQRVLSEDWAEAPDTAFDNVSLGGKAQEILWGKI